MFDVNLAISEWLGRLAQGGSCRKLDIDELECHLREEIQQLEGSSPLSEEEAFLVATHRLGDAENLSREFRKINQSVLWGHRLFWAATGLYAYLMMKYLLGAASLACVWIGVRAGLRAPWLGWINVTAKGAILAGGILLFYRIFRQDASGAVSRWGKKLEGRKRRWVLLAASVVLASLLVFSAHLAMPLVLARSLSASDYGSMMVMSAYANLAWSVLLPVGLACFILRLLTSGRSDGLHRA